MESYLRKPLVGGDIEAGYRGGSDAMLYPGLAYEDAYLRWAFIRKVYGIVLAQLVLTGLASLVVIMVPEVRNFIFLNPAILIVTIVLQIGVLFSLYWYHRSHPTNLILLGIWTLTFSVTIGSVCAFLPGLIVLEAVLLTAAVFVSLTAYTFWAGRKGYDFSYLGPMLFAGLTVLVIWGVVQLFIVPGATGRFIYALVGSLLFSLYIIYDTDNLIHQYSIDDYIWASVALYLDVVNLFVLVLDMIRYLQGSD
ncbi:hypothetical protein CBR_g39736 [Chara braunii]|uniref:BI1-like protein n=1 Tax=Chara braunii TaxID=69332 RepID=A0A388LSD0_CHABU|nr:hypothetical protein CBR_g39736 [Chara braunii]|eukprot:GBG85171.1 hypothetical protein CBR_g39736 [Chara braunii]